MAGSVLHEHKTIEKSETGTGKRADGMWALGFFLGWVGGDGLFGFGSCESLTSWS